MQADLADWPKVERLYVVFVPIEVAFDLILLQASNFKLTLGFDTPIVVSIRSHSATILEGTPLRRAGGFFVLQHALLRHEVYLVEVHHVVQMLVCKELGCCRLWLGILNA